MGEKIKTLSKGEFFGSTVEIELNRPVVEPQGQQIHIQSKNFRLELKKKEYVKYALSILNAEKNLKNLKNIP
ncbi:MAG TPA: hypothetical protein P5246_04665 [Candidatus Omnitrophota bacterium]|nr:hypothetical protein [Candidatus Omnitrophota bacterium]HSA31393.1 hypothetical protein [Candidatus Omnitrophota bacterium]